MTWKNSLPWLGGSFAGYIVNRIFETSESFLIEQIPYLSPVDFVFIAMAIIGIIVLVRSKSLPKDEKDGKLVREYKNIIDRLEKNPEIRLNKTIDTSAEFLKGAKKVYALGITVSVLSDLHVDKTVDLIKNHDTQFTIIIPDKDSIQINYAEHSKIITSKSTNDIETQLDRFQTLNSELPQSKRQNLHIRTFDFSLLHSMLIVNPQDEGGHMTISLYDYNTSASQRPEIFITKKNNPELFDKFFKSFQFVLENSKEWKFSD